MNDMHFFLHWRHQYSGTWGIPNVEQRCFGWGIFEKFLKQKYPHHDCLEFFHNYDQPSNFNIKCWGYLSTLQVPTSTDAFLISVFRSAIPFFSLIYPATVGHKQGKFSSLIRNSWPDHAPRRPGSRSFLLES